MDSRLCLGAGEIRTIPLTAQIPTFGGLIDVAIINETYPHQVW